MFTNVPLTFRIFMGRADPVPRKTTSGNFSPSVGKRKVFSGILRAGFIFPFQETSPEPSAAAVAAAKWRLLHASTSSRKFGTSDASFTNSSGLQVGTASLPIRAQTGEWEESEGGVREEGEESGGGGGVRDKR